MRITYKDIKEQAVGIVDAASEVRPSVIAEEIADMLVEQINEEFDYSILGEHDDKLRDVLKDIILDQLDWQEIEEDAMPWIREEREKDEKADAEYNRGRYE